MTIDHGGGYKAASPVPRFTDGAGPLPLMSSPTLHVAVLAAGKGTRMPFDGSKVRMPACGQSVLAWVLDAAAATEPESVHVVTGHDRGAVEALVEAWAASAAAEAPDTVACVVQEQQNGTGHAVRIAMGGAREGLWLVVCGDTPCMDPADLADVVQACPEGGASLLTFEPPDPSGYGRILRGKDGGLVGIVEQADADDDQKAVTEVNSGVMCFDAAAMGPILEGLGTDNAQGEQYLTEALVSLASSGAPVVLVVAPDADSLIGINDPLDLASARAILRERILVGHMLAGVDIEDPDTTWIEAGVDIGSGTRVFPHTVIRSGVKVGDGCEVGPFSHLRPGTVLENGAQIGNFVESKNGILGAGAKAKHLTYLGDCSIGAGANIGAGTITANYDGKDKHHTEIGPDAFVGSGTVIVAPATIGRGATTGAGAVVTRNTVVEDGTVVVGVPARPLDKGGDAREEVDE